MFNPHSTLPHDFLTSPPPPSPSTIPDPTLERTFRGHTSPLTSLSFSPNMTQLVSSSADNYIMLWNFKPQLRAFKFIGHKGPVNSVEFSPSGHLLASASSDKTVRLWLPTARGESVQIKGHTAPVRSVAFSNDCNNLITASDDKTIKIWSLPSKKFKCSLTGHSNWVRSAKFSPDSRLAVSGGDDKTVRLWDVERKEQIRMYSDHTSLVNSVNFSPDGTAVASASADRTLKIWDLRSNSLLQHYNAHSDSATSLSFHSSGNYVLSSGLDGTLKIWDLREGQLLYTLHGHQGAATASTFEKNGSYFASGGSDNIVMVWKSHLSTIVGGDAPVVNNGGGVSGAGRGMSTTVNSGGLPKFKGNGNDRVLSFSSPSKKGREEKESASMKVSGGANASMGRSIGRVTSTPTSPTRNTPTRVYNAQAPGRTAGGGKEFVLEELSSGDVTTLPQSTTDTVHDEHGNGISETYNPAAVNKEQLPEVLAGALDHIVGQLDMITRTLSILDKRLSLQEELMAKHVTEQGEEMLSKHSSGLEEMFRSSKNGFLNGLVEE